MGNETMDRGSEPLKQHLDSCEALTMRQTRRGCIQEILGCEARTEFKYFIGDTQVAHSLEESDCCCRLFCTPIYPYKVVVKEMNTDAEIVTVERPTRCAGGGCKCCCYQEVAVSSGGEALGTFEEQCYYCVPEYHVKDDQGNGIYKVHPPTCVGGMCVNCCAEGNPCGKGCCKVPFHIFPADATNTNDGNTEELGKILKKPKSLMTELFTDANAFDITFPSGSKVSEKGILVGATLLLNSVFFEENEGGGE